MADSDVTRLAGRARELGRLGIDTEFMPEGRYRPLLCLVQVVVGEEVVILDPLADDYPDVAPLAACLADPAVEVVLHAGRQDVALLRREWETEVTNVFDTQVAAGFAGFSAQAGYLGLLGDALKIRLSKSASFTRWDVRPLTDEQLRYAAEDVEHLLPLADELQRRLTAAGRLEWAREECRPLESATDARDPAALWRRLPRATGLSGRERAVAQALAAWREQTAAAEDKPVGTILRDPSVVELAKRQPSSRKALGAIRGLTPDVLRRRGNELIAAIEAGKAAEPIKLAPDDRQHTDAADAPVLALAESLVRTRALAAGLAYELLAARADLTPIVVAARKGKEPPPVRTLTGWRREVVGDELLALLRGEVTLRVEGSKVAVSG